MQTKIKKRIIAFSVLLVFLITASILKIASKEEVPTISINYGKMIDELTKPQNYDPNQNAAPIIINALKSLKGHYVPSSTCYKMPIRIAEIHPKRLEHLKKWIESNETAFALTSHAVNKPYFWERTHLNLNLEIEDTTWQYWLNISDLVNLLVWRARLQEHENPSKALSYLSLAYKVSTYMTKIQSNSACDAYPIESYFAREQISKNMIDIIESNNIDRELLNQTQEIFERLKLESLTNSIEISRLISLDEIQKSFTDDGNGNGKYIIRKFKDFDTGLMGRDRGDYPAYLKYISRTRREIDNRKITTEKLNKAHNLAIKLSHHTPWEIFNENQTSHGAILEKIGGQNHLTSGFCRNELTYKHYYEGLCLHQALISILAINRYKADKGQLPETLEKLLEDGYIKKIPMDPYSDKPLIYKLTDKGFILYSVGRNFKDDGGTYTEFESWTETRKVGDYIFWPVFPKENETPENTEIDSFFTDPNYDPNYMGYE